MPKWVDEKAPFYRKTVKGRVVPIWAGLAIAAASAGVIFMATRRRVQAPGIGPVAQASVLPDSQFALFLSLAIASRARPEVPDSVYTCRADANYTEFRWIAAYRVLSVTPYGDSAIGSVATTAVGIASAANTDWVVTLGVREDTARFRLIKSADDPSRWKVCGDAWGGWSPLAVVPRIARWNPAGSDRQTVIAMVDSIRKARALPIVR